MKTLRTSVPINFENEITIAITKRYLSKRPKLKIGDSQKLGILRKKILYCNTRPFLLLIDIVYVLQYMHHLNCQFFVNAFRYGTQNEICYTHCPRLYLKAFFPKKLPLGATSPEKL